MSNPVDISRDYKIRDMLDEGFDFSKIEDLILKEENVALIENPSGITLIVEFIYPDNDKITAHLLQKKIKSHEKQAIYHKIIANISSALEIAVENLKHVKQEFGFEYQIKYEKETPKSNTLERKGKIRIKFEEETEATKLLGIFSQLSFEKVDLCSEIHITVLTNSPAQEIFSKILEKKPIKEFQSFMTLSDKEKYYELMSHPIFCKIVLSSFFPFDNEDISTTVTLDFFQNDLPAKKGRAVSYKGEKFKFHEILDRTLTCETFSSILDKNNICSLYTGSMISGPNQEPAYLIIDVDVSSVIKKQFEDQIVWELIINNTKSLIKTLTDLGLPFPAVKLSGSRGVHLYYRLERNIIDDIEGRADLPEFYIYKDQIPNYNRLKRITNSPTILNDKFKFLKRIVQAICLKSIYHTSVKIPKQITDSFGEKKVYKYFTLSAFTKNIVAVHDDTSPITRGVFRTVLCPHLNTGLLSIPLCNHKHKKFLKGYDDYNQIKEMATVDFVLERFHEGEVEVYEARPPIINRDMLKNLFYPNKIVPYLCILLRFETIQSCERSGGSFSFWFRYYQLRAFYNYLLSNADSFDMSCNNPNQFLFRLSEIRNTMHVNVLNYKKIQAYISKYFGREISYPLFRERIKALYTFNFFFELKYDTFQEEQIDNIELYDDKYTLQIFLSQAESLLTIVVESISSLTFHSVSLTKNKLIALHNLDIKISDLLETAFHFFDQWKKIEVEDIHPDHIKQISHIIKEIIHICKNFLSVYFGKYLEEKLND